MKKVEVIAPNEAIEDHLARVKKRMQHRGPPKIQAIFVDDVWYALEGSHRIQAALELGWPILIVPRTRDFIMKNDFVQLNMRRNATGYNPVKQILDLAMSDQGPRLKVRAIILK